MKKSTPNGKLWQIVGILAVIASIPVLAILIQYSFLLALYPPKMATKEEKVDAMKNARFDKSIIDGIAKYDTLNTLLKANIDTLLGYRNSKNKVIAVSAGSKQTEEIISEDCHIFFPGYKDGYTDNLPSFFHAQFKTLVDKYFNNKEPQFYLCKNGRITYFQKLDELGDGLYLYHELIYMNGDEKYKTEKFYDVKDTMLRDNVIYNIYLDEHHGH